MTIKTPLILPLLLISLMSGCAATRDGFRIPGTGGPSSQSDIDQVRAQLESSARNSVAKHAALSALKPSAKAGILVVGTVGPIKKLDESDKKSAYKEYLKAAEKWHPSKPAELGEREFTKLIAGATSVETYAVPGFITYRQPALVPITLVDNIDFASLLGSFMVGTTGDLVQGRSNGDGVYILESILCKDGQDYRNCAQQYERGRFDANTGKELDRNMKVKEGGVTVDLATFKKVNAATSDTVSAK